MTFWDIVAPLYDTFESLNKAHQQMVRLVCNLTPQGSTVLELASGTGDISLTVSDKSVHVLCTDISNSMLKVAQRKAKRRRIENISFEELSICETSKTDNSFDVVIASQVLHLLDTPQNAGTEIKRIVKNTVILPIPLVKDGTLWGKLLIKLYKLLGFHPKRELDRNSCRKFLEEIGFDNCEYHMIEGTIAICVAVWRKH